MLLMKQGTIRMAIPQFAVDFFIDTGKLIETAKAVCGEVNHVNMIWTQPKAFEMIGPLGRYAFSGGVDYAKFYALPFRHYNKLSKLDEGV